MRVANAPLIAPYALLCLGVLAFNLRSPIQQASVGGDQRRVVQYGRRRDESVGGVAAEVLDLDSQYRNVSGQRQFLNAGLEDQAPLLARIAQRAKATFRDQECQFPKADCANSEMAFLQGRDCHRSGLSPKRLIVAQKPDSRMGVEQDHLSAFHSTSIGETISPVMNRLSFNSPNAFGRDLRCGTSSATGLPFFVITTDAPVRSTSSIRARHFALNSEALIVRVIAFARCFQTMTMVMTMVILARGGTFSIAPPAAPARAQN